MQKVKNTDMLFFFYTNVQPIQGSSAIQGKGLLKVAPL